MCRSLPFRLLVGVLLLALSIGVVPASAADYPPSNRCQGHVDRTHVKAGGCILFSGSDFKPGTDITITDNGRVVGHTTADSHGSFRYQVCFGTDAELGRHVLAAHGEGFDGAACDPTDTVTVEGVSTSRPPPSNGNGNGGANGNGGGNGSADGSGDGNGGAIPFTGQELMLILTVGLLLLVVGTAVTGQSRRRHADT